MIAEMESGFGSGGSIPPAPPASPESGSDNGDTNDVPAESIEKGADASRYVENPDKPDPTSVAQLEVLPGESSPGDS